MARYNTKEKVAQFPCGLTTELFKLEMTKDKTGAIDSFMLTIYGKKDKIIKQKVDKKGLNIAFTKIKDELKSLFLTQKRSPRK